MIADQKAKRRGSFRMAFGRFRSFDSRLRPLRLRSGFRAGALKLQAGHSGWQVEKRRSLRRLPLICRNADA